MFRDEQFLAGLMKIVLATAVKGVAKGQAPFAAAVFQRGGNRVALEHNRANELGLPLAHAEILALSSACRELGRDSLEDCFLLATAEPCAMCMSAAIITGIQWVAYGAGESTVRHAGYGGLDLKAEHIAKASEFIIHVRPGVLARECEALLMNHKREPQ